MQSTKRTFSIRDLIGEDPSRDHTQDNDNVVKNNQEDENENIPLLRTNSQQVNSGDRINYSDHLNAGHFAHIARNMTPFYGRNIPDNFPTQRIYDLHRIYTAKAHQLPETLTNASSICLPYSVENQRNVIKM